MDADHDPLLLALAFARARHAADRDDAHDDDGLTVASHLRVAVASDPETLDWLARLVAERFDDGALDRLMAAVVGAPTGTLTDTPEGER